MDAIIISHNAQLANKLVLVVEDDPDLRQIIQWMLEDEGFVVETAGDGREALARAGRQKPSLVILDIGLPIIDGYGVAAGLHSAYGDAIHILTMTAGGQAEEKARQMGAVGYLNKPFEMDALLNAVRTALIQA
ncbi:MAG TPA: response regulator transcription factor [Ktedonosporobacter sp.]|nr:response regulator transcription factor [Ktedonosporobacter sp.]